MTNKTENDIAKFFRGRDASFKLFKLLRKLIEQDRSPKIEVSKTQIFLVRAGSHPDLIIKKTIPVGSARVRDPADRLATLRQ